MWVSDVWFSDSEWVRQNFLGVFWEFRGYNLSYESDRPSSEQGFYRDPKLPTQPQSKQVGFSGLSASKPGFEAVDP